jgi:hypothetical protein
MTFSLKGLIKSRNDAQTFDDIIQFCLENGINLRVLQDGNAFHMTFEGSESNMTFQWLKNYVKHKHKGSVKK